MKPYWKNDCPNCRHVLSRRLEEGSDQGRPNILVDVYHCTGHPGGGPRECLVRVYAPDGSETFRMIGILQRHAWHTMDPSNGSLVESLMIGLASASRLGLVGKDDADCALAGVQLSYP